MSLPLAPTYGEQLGASPLELAAMVAGFFLGRAATWIPSGVMIRKLGPRPSILIGVVLLTVSAVVWGAVRTPCHLILACVLQGAGLGLYTISLVGLLSISTDEGNRGRAFGILSLAMVLGLFIGPLLGGLLAHVSGVQAPFASLTGICAVSFLLALKIRVGDGRGNTTPSPAVEVLSVSAYRSSWWPIGISNLLFTAGLGMTITLFPIFGAKHVEGGIAFVGAAYAAGALSVLVLWPFLSRVRFTDRVLAAGVFSLAVQPLSVVFSTSPWVLASAFFLGGVGLFCYFHTERSARADVRLGSDLGGAAGALAAVCLWQSISMRASFLAEAVLLIIAGLLILVRSRETRPRISPPAE